MFVFRRELEADEIAESTGFISFLIGITFVTGIWKGNKGDSYIGEWKLGKADGMGVHIWINGFFIEKKY